MSAGFKGRAGDSHLSTLILEGQLCPEGSVLVDAIEHSSRRHASGNLTR